MGVFTERKRWLFLGLPFTFTLYSIDEDSLNVKTGLLNTRENDCYLYKIQDIQLETSIFERMFGLSTVICYTGDVSDKVIKLVHVKNGKEIKEYLMKKSDEERIKRRTINTLNINADNVSDDID